MIVNTFVVPQPGNVITVTTRHVYTYYKTTERTRDTTYENVPVIEPQRWTPPGSFCIPADGEPFINFRTIDIAKVVDLTVHGEATELNTNTSTTFVTVQGSGGKTYRVTVVGGVAKECECLGYQYRKSCRHLREAMGTTPVNPRRATVRKQASRRSAQKTQPRRKGAPTKADRVRKLIAKHKATHNQAGVAEIVMKEIGFKRGLAMSYVRNNWSKV